MSKLNIVELLKLCGFDPTGKRVKIARHRDARISVHSLFAENEFEIYQSYQKKPNIFDCDYVVSCLGLESRLAKVIGVYQVGAKTCNVTPINLPASLAAFMQETHDHYKLKRLDGTEHQSLVEGIYDRVITRWTPDAINWCRPLTADFEVIQVLPRHYADEFPGYLELELAYDRLSEMVANETRYREWHLMLKAVKGIYAVFDKREARFYVGAAYGRGGVLERWRDYANNGFGDSIQLKQIIEADPNRVNDLVFSILQPLSVTATNMEVLGLEVVWKLKLRARDLGYCSN
jgi:hypothetical protein